MRSRCRQRGKRQAVEQQEQEQEQEQNSRKEQRVQVRVVGMSVRRVRGTFALIAMSFAMRWCIIVLDALVAGEVAVVVVKVLLDLQLTVTEMWL